MPKSGGSATITGIDFELWFVALQFADAFFDENLEVTPQAQTYIDPKTQKVEIVAIDDVYIHSDSKQEFYNLKFRAPNIRSWTINGLKQQKVLHQFKKQFIKSPDASLYFVTQSPCPIFAEVLPRGAFYQTREELDINLKANNYIKEWDKLQKLLGFSDDIMISFAKQVKYKHIIDNEEMKKDIKYRLQGHVTSCSFAPDCLYQLAIEAGKSSKAIKRDDVIEFLKKNNIHMKSHLRIEDLLDKLNKASANLYSINGNIENEHIERGEVNTLVNWIHTPLKEESSVAVLTGKAGCGKTVIQRDLFLKIQRENIPVLGMKADLLMFDTIEALSNEVGLSGGIVAAMATLVEKYEKGVVIFDQIDALSFTLGKDRKSINTYFNLINQLSDIKGIRIILSCRSFDLKYDPILKSLEHKYTVDVKELSDQQVDKVLIKLGIERKKISNRLLDLLRTPLHLKIFRDIYYPDTDFNSINTLHNLYNELYNQKILNDINGDLQKDVFKTLDIMIDKMDNSKVLTVPFSLLERNSQGINYLSSQSIAIRYNNKIQFFHSTFFDYCYARTFLLRHDSLIKIVLGQHQGLFIRPQVKQVLAYLRDSDFSAYLKELKEFLTNHKIRFHIRLLVINQLAFLKNPKDKEWSIVKQLLEKDDNFKKHFINAIQSEKWLKYLILSGYLQILLQSGDEKIINLIIGKLRILINFYTNTIVNFLQQFPNIIKKDEYVVQVLIGLEHWEDEQAIRLFQDHLKVIKSGYSFYYYSHFLLGILEYNPETVCKIFFADIFEKINAVSSADEFDKNHFFSHYDIKILKELLNWNSDLVLTKSLQLIQIMVDKTRMKSKNGFFSDRTFFGYERYNPDLNPQFQVLKFVLEKLETVAINDKSKFLILVKEFDKSRSSTLLKIVLHGYNAKSDLYVEEFFSLFCRKGFLDNATYNFEVSYKLRILLRNIYPLFSKEQKEKINKLILSVSPYWEKDRKKGQRSLMGYAMYELLNAIPDNDISNYPFIKKKFQELERKFGKFKEKTIRIDRGKGIGPPLPRIAYEKMTQEQWLSSFRKYDESTSWGMPREELLKGGIIENSRAFTEQVSKRPDEFYDFVFDIGGRDDVSISYLGAGLEGLITGNYDIEKIKKLIKTYWRDKDTEFRRGVIRAIEYIDRKANLDLDLIEILAEYALNDPDPKEELWETDAYQGTPSYGGDPHSQGINTVRGSATERLVIHGFDTQYPEKIFEILHEIAEDKSVAVRCCLIRYLQGMIKWNKNKTFKLFKKITSDKHPQVIKYGLECLYYLMNKNNFRSFIFYLERAMILEDTFDNSNLGELIGPILTIAYLRSYPNSKNLLEKGYDISEEIKISAIECASRHLSCSNTKIADKSKKIYMRFFYEADDKIGLQYDLCFLDFKVEDFNKIYSLILEYSKTEIVEKHCSNFFEFLAKVVNLEPEKCISVLQNYKNFESPDIRYNALQGKLVQILIEAYNRVIDDIYKEKAMKVFDAILQVGVYTKDALNVLAEQDRE